MCNILKNKLYSFLTTWMFVLAGFSSFGQNYTMQNGTEDDCAGNFFDSGGNAGDYSSSENFVYTFCSTTPGDVMQFVFSAFSIENNFDDLNIFDGATTVYMLKLQIA